MTLLTFLAGAAAMGYMLAALFFLRFWRDMREPLFLWFAIAFLLLGLAQALLALTNIPVEERSSLYLLRLAAFVMILIAVIRKNVEAR